MKQHRKSQLTYRQRHFLVSILVLQLFSTPWFKRDIGADLWGNGGTKLRSFEIGNHSMEHSNHSSPRIDVLLKTLTSIVQHCKCI